MLGLDLSSLVIWFMC